jgi:hypothetical protein
MQPTLIGTMGLFISILQISSVNSLEDKCCSVKFFLQTRKCFISANSTMFQCKRVKV